MDGCRAMIAAQGGDPDAALPRPAETHTVAAPRSGVITRVDARAVGVCAWRLGAGRTTATDAVQPAAGVTLHAKPGDTVRAGDPVATLQTDEAERFPRAKIGRA